MVPPYGVGVGVGSGVGSAVGVAVAATVGLGVGFFVGFGVGFGVAAGRQPATPLPLTEPLVFATRYFSSGSVPVGGKIAAASAVIRLRFGIWMDPRASEPDETRGELMT